MSRKRLKCAIGVLIAVLVALCFLAASAMASSTKPTDQLAYYTVNDGTNFSRSTSPITASVTGGGTATETASSDGSVTLSITGVASGKYADLGFYASIGTLGNLNGLLVKGSGNYGLNLWFDTGGDGSFFTWNSSSVETGLNSDKYILGPSSSSGDEVITPSSQFTSLNPGGGNYTLAQLKAGNATGISSSTPVAVWVGVTDTGAGDVSATISSLYVSSGTLTDVYADPAYTDSASAAADGHIYGVDAFSTIAAAAAALPSSGGTIHLNGTFNEQFTTTANINLVGSGESTTTIQAPSSLSTFNTYKPVVGASGDTFNASNLTVDCNSVGDSNSGLVGALWYNSSGTADTVNTIHCKDTSHTGSQEGIGFLNVNADGTSRTWNVKNSSASDYQKGGFVAKKSGLTATFTSDTATGLGPTSGAASNGFEIAFGAGGSISDCTSKDNYWTGTYGGTNDPTTDSNADAAAGIILYQAASGVTVTNCTLSGNQFSVYATETSGYTVSGSTLTGAADQGSAKVVGVASFNSQYGDASAATGATLTNNVVSNVDWPVIAIDLASGNDVTVTGHGNQFSYRTAGAFNGGSNTLNLTGNWWGTANGPGAIANVDASSPCSRSDCTTPTSSSSGGSSTPAPTSYSSPAETLTVTVTCPDGSQASGTGTGSAGTSTTSQADADKAAKDSATSAATSAANANCPVKSTTSSGATSTSTPTSTSVTTTKPNQSTGPVAVQPTQSGTANLVLAPPSGGTPTTQSTFQASWPAGTFGSQPVNITIAPQLESSNNTSTPVAGNFLLGSSVINFTAASQSDNQAIHTLLHTVSFKICPAAPNFVAGYSEDKGKTWTPMPPVPAGTQSLTGSQQDGFYLDGTGCAIVLTNHLTSFAMLRPVPPPTPAHLTARLVHGQLHLSWTRSKSDVGVDRYVVHFWQRGEAAARTTRAVIRRVQVGLYYVVAVAKNHVVGAKSNGVVVRRKYHHLVLQVYPFARR